MAVEVRVRRQAPRPVVERGGLRGLRVDQGGARGEDMEIVLSASKQHFEGLELHDGRGVEPFGRVASKSSGRKRPRQDDGLGHIDVRGKARRLLAFLDARLGMAGIDRAQRQAARDSGGQRAAAQNGRVSHPDSPCRGSRRARTFRRISIAREP